MRVSKHTGDDALGQTLDRTKARRENHASEQLPPRQTLKSRFHQAVVDTEPYGVLVAATGLLIASFAFLLDLNDRTEERTVRAWQVVTTPACGNSGKREALEYLNSGKYEWWPDWVHWPFKKRTELIGLNLSRDPMCSTDTYLQRVNLYRAKLDQARLSSVDLSSAILTEASMVKVNLTGASLSEASLLRASMVRANLTEVNMQRTKLIAADLSRANLYLSNGFGAELSRAILVRVNLGRARFTEADMSGANLKGAKIRDAVLHSVNLAGANLAGAVLNNSDLTDANLTGSNLGGASFLGTDMTGVATAGAWYAEGKAPRGIALSTLKKCPKSATWPNSC